jgi:hypothetical protein
MHRRGVLDLSGIDQIGQGLQRTERLWMEQIRYIY